MKKLMNLTIIVVVPLMILSPVILMEVYNSSQVRTTLSVYSKFKCSLVDKENENSKKIYKQTEVLVTKNTFARRHGLSDLELEYAYFDEFFSYVHKSKVKDLFINSKKLQEEKSYSLFLSKSDIMKQIILMNYFNIYCKKISRSPLDNSKNEYWIEKEEPKSQTM